MLLALAVGPMSFVVKMSNGDYSVLVQVLAIAAILPSAITLKGEELGMAFRMWKEILVAVVFASAITPMLAWLLSNIFSEKLVGTGFFIVNLVPGSSAALEYVMLASGNIELATVLVVLLTLLTFLIVPSYLALYSSVTRVEIPIMDVVNSLIVVLLVPLIFGQLIRFYIIRRSPRLLAVAWPR